MKYRFDYSKELQNDILFFNEAKEQYIDDQSSLNKLELISALIKSLSNQSNIQLLDNWNSLARARGDIIEYEKNDLYLIIRYYFSEFQSFLKNDHLLCFVIYDSIATFDCFKIQSRDSHIVVELFLKLN